MVFGENGLPYLRRSVVAIHSTSAELGAACRRRCKWPSDVRIGQSLDAHRDCGANAQATMPVRIEDSNGSLGECDSTCENRFIIGYSCRKQMCGFVAAVGRSWMSSGL